jgi:hypothetical protein
MAALEAFYTHALEVMGEQMHSYSNFIVELDGPAEAHGTNYLLAVGRTKEGSSIQTTSFNEDAYVKRNGAWLISQRICNPWSR